MQIAVLDAMIAQVAHATAAQKPADFAALVQDLATDWPNEPALALCFALTSAAADLETLLADHRDVAQGAYRTAALVAADILAIESMGQQPAKAQHLVHFWRRAGPDYLIR